ncbi:MAG: IPT/TIG domain-containing protein [Phycisphaerales bacterium]|nr:MAG: IPT/TIG domain-containing protein [Phycisphaerales bacterium]
MSRVCRLAVVSAGGIVLCGCTPAHHAAIELDKVARSIDRYGFASISTPFLAGPSDNFDFDLDKPASEFFDLASKPQGGVRHFRAEALDVQVAFRANIDQAISALAELKNVKSPDELRVAKAKAGIVKSSLEALAKANPLLGQNPMVGSLVGLLGVADEVEEPTPPAGETTTEATPEEKQPSEEPKKESLPELAPLFSGQLDPLSAVGASFTEGLSLPEGPYQISAREALMIASGDVTTQALLRWFNKPHGNKQAGYELFFCPMVVSVQPGFQTRNQYVADVTVNVDLARKRCSCPLKSQKPCTCPYELEYLRKKFPNSSPPIQVAGVFPVIDAQVLNLVNSRRQLHSLALQLSLMGYGSQADFFKRYVKKLERDAKTQTALTAASSYTIGDTAFGFRVEPKFVASKDPTQLETEPGRILESRAFPAMAAVLVDRKYLSKRPPDNCGCPDQPCNEHSECGRERDRNKDAYDFLVFETSTRWSPMTEWKRVFGGALSWFGRLSEVELWQRAAGLESAKARVAGLTPGYEKAHLESRITSLRKLGLDSRAVIRVFDGSAAERICIAKIWPKHGWWDQYTVLTIRGKGFRHNVKSVTVGGIYCAFAVPNDRTLLALVPPWGQAKKDLPQNANDLADAVGKAAERTDLRIVKATKVPSSHPEAQPDEPSWRISPERVPIAIGSRVPLCAHCGQDICRDTFPDESSDCAMEKTDGTCIGWITFDKRLSKPEKDD